MDKNGVLTISNWTDGMGNSPFQGHAVIKNCEVFDTPNVLKIANKIQADGNTYTGFPVARVKDVYGNEFVLVNGGAANGVLYKNGTSLTSSLGTCYDMAIMSDYLFYTHGSKVSIYGPLAGPAVNYDGQYTLNTSGYWHKLLVDENPDGSVGAFAMYVTDGNIVQTIRSFVSQASPGTMSTGLTLPSGEYAVTMASLGSNILIGTQAGGSYADKTNYRVANIYPWDKSISNSFRKPVRLNENGISAMISDNNRLVVVAGDRGNVYLTNGTDYNLVKRIPWTQDRSYGQTIQVYPNALFFNQEGNLLLGTSTLTDSFSNDVLQGVFEMKLSGSYPVVFKYTISTGNYGLTQALKIGFIQTEGSDIVYIGWQDGSSYGVDESNFYTYSSYGAVFESKVYLVGGRLSRKSFQNLEFELSKKLISGQGVRISYRKSLDEDYTTIGTFDYATLGSVLSHNSKALIDDAEILQIKIELTQSSTEVNNNVNLLAVRLW